MGQIKKLVPRHYRDAIFESVDKRLPEGSFVRNQFANGVSALGAALVVGGAYADSRGFIKTGTVLRTIGETGDDLDGDTARRLGTASDGGALVDASLDKVKVAAEAFTLWKHATSANKGDTADRRGRIAVIAGKHVATAALNIYMTANNIETESSEAGKINMWADGAAIGLWSISDASDRPSTKIATETLGNIAFTIGLGTGAAAIYGYAMDARQSTNDDIIPAQHATHLAVVD